MWLALYLCRSSSVGCRAGSLEHHVRRAQRDAGGLGGAVGGWGVVRPATKVEAAELQGLCSRRRARAARIRGRRPERRERLGERTVNRPSEKLPLGLLGFRRARSRTDTPRRPGPNN